MKKTTSLALGAILAASASLAGCGDSNAQQATGYEAIYKALNVPETRPEGVTNMMVTEKIKAAGGLVCSFATDINSGDMSYGCGLMISEHFNHADIYDALDVKEDVLAGNRPVVKYVKSVGSLECTKSTHPEKDDAVMCNLGQP